MTGDARCKIKQMDTKETKILVKANLAVEPLRSNFCIRSARERAFKACKSFKSRSPPDPRVKMSKIRR